MINSEKFRELYARAVGCPASATREHLDPFTDALVEQVFYDSDALDRKDLISRIVIERDCLDRAIALVLSVDAAPLDANAADTAKLAADKRRIREYVKDHPEGWVDDPMEWFRW